MHRLQIYFQSITNLLYVVHVSMPMSQFENVHCRSKDFALKAYIDFSFSFFTKNLYDFFPKKTWILAFSMATFENLTY